MATAVELVFLPEVDHVHQQLSADAAHEARWMPELIVAGAVCVHRWGPFSHLLVAVEAQLQDGETRNINQKQVKIFTPTKTDYTYPLGSTK